MMRMLGGTDGMIELGRLHKRVLLNLVVFFTFAVTCPRLPRLLPLLYNSLCLRQFFNLFSLLLFFVF